MTPISLSEYSAKHVIRRDGWCQECGRWPTAKGGPCPIVEAIDAERVDGHTAAEWRDSCITNAQALDAAEDRSAALAEALEQIIRLISGAVMPGASVASTVRSTARDALARYKERT